MKSAHLVYCIVCDDVRLEVGNKISLMGVFENLFVPTFPAMLFKLAVVNHWEGEGEFETQVRLLYPDRGDFAVSMPSRFVIDRQGYADNITFFTNLTFDRAGTYTVQTYLDGLPMAEKSLYVHLVPPPATVH